MNRTDGKKNVLVVGGGGREHAIIKALLKSNKINKLYAAPGNGGIALDGVKCFDVQAVDVEAVVNIALENNVDFAVVAPDDPLMLGMVDAFEKKE